MRNLAIKAAAACGAGVVVAVALVDKAFAVIKRG